MIPQTSLVYLCISDPASSIESLKSWRGFTNTEAVSKEIQTLLDSLMSEFLTDANYQKENFENLLKATKKIHLAMLDADENMLHALFECRVPDVVSLVTQNVLIVFEFDDGKTMTDNGFSPGSATLSYEQPRTCGAFAQRWSLCPVENYLLVFNRHETRGMLSRAIASPDEANHSQEFRDLALEIEASSAPGTFAHIFIPNILSKFRRAWAYSNDRDRSFAADSLRNRLELDRLEIVENSRDFRFVSVRSISGEAGDATTSVRIEKQPAAFFPKVSGLPELAVLGAIPRRVHFAFCGKIDGLKQWWENVLSESLRLDSTLDETYFQNIASGMEFFFGMKKTEILDRAIDTVAVYGPVREDIVNTELSSSQFRFTRDSSQRFSRPALFQRLGGEAYNQRLGFNPMNLVYVFKAKSEADANFVFDALVAIYGDSGANHSIEQDTPEGYRLIYPGDVSDRPVLLSMDGFLVFGREKDSVLLASKSIREVESRLISNPEVAELPGPDRDHPAFIYINERERDNVPSMEYYFDAFMHPEFGFSGYCGRDETGATILSKTPVLPFFAATLPRENARREARFKEECFNNLRRLAQNCGFIAQQNGKYPSTFSEVYGSGFMAVPFTCPHTPVQTQNRGGRAVINPDDIKNSRIFGGFVIADGDYTPRNVAEMQGRPYLWDSEPRHGNKRNVAVFRMQRGEFEVNLMGDTEFRALLDEWKLEVDGSSKR
ncbi:MAG: hypothetical protein NUW37_17090 [Planctomycetes bacterium]|nr:hypothetical protein [Planctomycetota bacterium]